MQAPASLPPLDGAPRGAGLRPVDEGVAVAPARARRHPHREHESGDRSDAAPLAQLADGGGDHEAPRPPRSLRSGEVRLCAVPQAHVRRLPRPSRRRGMHTVRAPWRLQTLAGATHGPRAGARERATRGTRAGVSPGARESK